MKYYTVEDALRRYLTLAPAAEAPPSIAGSNLFDKAVYDPEHDVVSFETVVMPRVDGGSPDFESDLCELADISMCLPAKKEDILVLLCRTQWSVERSLNYLRQALGGRWSRKYFYKRLDLVYRQTRQRLLKRGLLYHDAPHSHSF